MELSRCRAVCSASSLGLQPASASGWSWSCPGTGCAFAHPLTRLRFTGSTAASTDEARPLLTGIRMVANADRLTLTSTDGYRVAEQSVHLAEPCAVAATVPARAMAEVARLFRHSAHDVEVSVGRQGNQVFFSGAEGEVSSRVIDGTYPNTRRLIPSGRTSRASVDAAELSQRLKAIAPFASASANVVHLEVLPDALVLSAAAVEVGSARTELRAEVSGTETRVSFNARYLLDCLSTAHEMVDLELQGPLAPIVVKRRQSADYVYLFMPVRQPL
jgi:DNA polymerase III subunit beta